MRNSKFNDHQNIAILKVVEAGHAVKDVFHVTRDDRRDLPWNSKSGESRQNLQGAGDGRRSSVKTDVSEILLLENGAIEGLNQ